MSPDYSGIDDGPPDAISFGDPADPQSLNLYSYVQNNPVVKTDSDGHDCIYADGNGGGSVSRGDCKSDTDTGVYVDGTIDVNSFKYRGPFRKRTIEHVKGESEPEGAEICPERA